MKDIEKIIERIDFIQGESEALSYRISGVELLISDIKKAGADCENSKDVFDFCKRLEAIEAAIKQILKAEDMNTDRLLELKFDLKEEQKTSH